MSSKSVEVRNYELDNLAWQLANDHGIGLSNNQIWFALYNDSGRDICLAEDLLEEMIDNPLMVSRFAQTLYSIKPEKMVLVGFSADALVLASALSALVGYLLGVLC
jgi:predicted esterase